MANGYSPLIGFIIVLSFSVASWFLAPKGETQIIWRQMLIMSAWACYIMWAVTFLAQLHPLIVPVNTHLREGYID